eukprot:m.136185 g.136185  ORF g.136185 m.136185 type:complete len:56 (+) comp13931_c0_seq7:1741-1908(+)
MSGSRVVVADSVQGGFDLQHIGGLVLVQLERLNVSPSLLLGRRDQERQSLPHGHP